MDRFLIKFAMGYPDREQEKIIMKKGSDDLASSLGAVTDTGAVNAMIAECENVGCTGAIEDYIMNIVELTRNSADIKLGVSPRGSMALKRAAKAYAMVKGRDYVLPDDVKYLAPFVLSHRLMLSPQGSSKYADKAQAIRDILNVAVVV